VTRRRLWWAVGALIAVGIAAEWAALRREPLQTAVGSGDIRRAVADLLAGGVLGACGLAAWTLRPRRPLGPLLVATAAAWFLGTLADSGTGWIADAGAALVLLHRGPFVHALVTYPDRRGTPRLSPAVIATGYVTAVLASLGETTAATIVLSVLLVAAIALRFMRAPARTRPALIPPLAVALAFAAVLVTGVVGSPDADTLLGLYEVVVAGGAAWLLADLLRARWAESAVTGLVLDLGRGSRGAPLERRLAEILGDPTVRLGYRMPGREGLVDAGGRPLDMAGGRVTRLAGAEAALVHDPGAIDDPALLESVAAAARIAVSNAQLNAVVHERVDELAASRRRIVEAADAQRARFERRLRSGPQTHLAEVRAALAACREAGEPTAFTTLLDETLVEVDRAGDELQEFARGVRPRILSEGGLAPAVAELARGSPVAVAIAAPAERFAPALEAVAYFVCAEALANAGKHAGAASASVRIAADGARLDVLVTDDGRGGATVVAGSGLRGLRDRVEALDGTLSVDSPPGAGTRLHATLPLEAA